MSDTEFPAPAGRRSVFARMAQLCRATLGVVLDTALPPLCASCRAPLGNPGGLCPACWSRVSFIAPPYCERLGIPFAYDAGPGILSMEAIADPPSYGRARAAVRFDDVARDLVHRLKYGDRLDLATTMGRWMARAGRELLDDADALVPVPLHWRRLWGRRFNQAAALAREIARQTGKAYEPHWLRRVKATRSQVGLSREQRALNVQGAFKTAREAPIRDRRIVLVDDVLTSGATANAASRALLRAGAVQVDLLVFARVVTGA